MAILLPQRWRQQPQGPVQIDNSNILSKDLAFCTMPYNGIYRNFTSKGAGRFTLGNSPEFTATSAGMGLLTSNSANSCAYATPGIVDRTRITMLWLGQSVGTPAGYAIAFSSVTSSLHQIRLYPSGAKAAFRYMANSSTGPVTGQATVADVFDGSINCVAVSWFSDSATSTNGGNFAVNGKFDKSFTGNTASYSNPQTDRYTIGAESRSTITSGTGFNGNTVLALQWNRTFSVTELTEITNNPWQVFKPQQQKYYSLPISYSRPTLDNTNNNQLNKVVGGTDNLIGSGSWGKYLPQRWRQQPQKPVDINWGNSLTNSLKGVLCANLLPPGALYLNTLSFIKNISTRYGSYIATSGNNSGIVAVRTPTGWSSGTYAMLGSLPQNYPNRVIGMGTGNQGDNPYFGFQQPFSTYGNYLTGGLRLTQDGAVSTVTSLTYPNTTDDPIKVHLWIVVYDGTANLNLYIDGKLDTNVQSGTASGTSNAISTMALSGSYSGGPAIWNVQHIMSLFWPRALSPAEIRELANNPWQLFKPKNTTIYVPPSGWTRIP